MSDLPAPFWQDETRGLRLFCADCRDILPHFADGDFGSVVTDPPYGIGIADWDIPPDSAILQECLRVATGTVVMFGPQYATQQRHYWDLRPPLDDCLAWVPRRAPFTEAWYPIFVWKPPSKALPKVIRDSFFIPGRLRTGPNPWDHDCQKPEAAIAVIVTRCEGAILDPYCGSGTTLAACAKLGMPCTGIEIDEKYCAMTVARLTEDLTYGPRSLFNPTGGCWPE